MLKTTSRHNCLSCFLKLSNTSFTAIHFLQTKTTCKGQKHSHYLIIRELKGNESLICDILYYPEIYLALSDDSLKPLFKCASPAGNVYKI